MKSLYFCKHCPQILHYSKGCNSFVGKTYVRLLATLTFVCGQDLMMAVRGAYTRLWNTLARGCEGLFKLTVDN